MLSTEKLTMDVIHNDCTRYYSLARYALIDALILLNIRQGSRVLLPEYICRDLLASLFRLGAVPCWYRVGPSFNPSTPPDVWPIAQAVLAVNYFGFEQDLRPFLRYAEITGATIIEDNSHGYLSRNSSGRWLGCRTDLGLFSFRKTIALPNGGALWVRPFSTNSDILVQEQFVAVGGFRSQLVKARLRALPIFGKGIRFYAVVARRMIRKWRTGCELPITDETSECDIPFSRSPWVGLKAALSNIDIRKEISRRRRLYSHFAVFGESVGASPVFEKLPPKCAPYGYAFRGDTKALREIRREGDSEGFDTIRWPDLPTSVADRCPPYYRDVFLVNFV